MNAQEREHYRIFEFIDKQPQERGVHYSELDKELGFTGQLRHDLISNGAGELAHYVREEKQGYFHLTDRGRYYHRQLKLMKEDADATALLEQRQNERAEKVSRSAIITNRTQRILGTVTVIISITAVITSILTYKKETPNYTPQLKALEQELKQLSTHIDSIANLKTIHVVLDSAEAKP